MRTPTVWAARSARRNSLLVGLCLLGAAVAVPAFAGKPASDTDSTAGQRSSSAQEKPASWQPSAAAPPPPSSPPPSTSGSKPTWQPSKPAPRDDSGSGWRSNNPRPSPGSPPPGTYDGTGGDRHRPDHRGGYRHRPRYYGGYYYGSPWYPGWGLFWDFYGYPYYWGRGWSPYYGYTTSYGSSVSGMGALDCDINPEDAQIYLDGKYVGICDDYDGFPEYLWLEKGTYDVAFYRPGFQTIARQYTIYAGLVTDVEDRMVPGEAVKPEDLGSRSTERRDARLEADREREWEVEQQQREMTAPPRQYSRSPSAPSSDAYDARRDPGRLRLQVMPPDASIYLDGRFIGTGEEVSRLHSGLILDPGEHRLEVVRPDYEAETQSFDVDPGEEVTLRIELDAN